MERSQNKEARPTNVENSRGMGQTDLQLGDFKKYAEFSLHSVWTIWEWGFWRHRIPWFGEVVATSSIADTSRSGKGGNHQLWWKRRSEILLTIMWLCSPDWVGRVSKVLWSRAFQQTYRHTGKSVIMYIVNLDIHNMNVCLCITASELFCKIYISTYNFFNFNIYAKNEDALHSHQLM